MSIATQEVDAGGGTALETREAGSQGMLQTLEAEPQGIREVESWLPWGGWNQANQ